MVWPPRLWNPTKQGTERNMQHAMNRNSPQCTGAVRYCHTDTLRERQQYCGQVRSTHLYEYTVYGGSVCLGILPQWMSGQQLPGTGLLASAVPVAQLMLCSGHRFISHTAKKKQWIFNLCFNISVKESWWWIYSAVRFQFALLLIIYHICENVMTLLTFLRKFNQ